MKLSLLSVAVLFSVFISAQVSQPLQPTTGPGSSEYTHGGVTQYDYGTNGSGGDFWLYEPNSPTPDSANVIVFIHGLGMTNPKYYGAFIKHLVRKGNIVIYPRYQKDLNASNTTFNDSCAHGIKRGLDTIKQAGHVKGRVENYFVLGHSVGGVLTANMTMLHAQYGLPKPLTAFSMQPGAAGFLMNDYSSFPGDVKYLIAIGNNDIIVGTGPGTTLFNQTVNVPTSRKNLIKHMPDPYGDPDIADGHEEPGAPDNDFDNGETNIFIMFAGGAVNSVDYYCFWKLQDALMDCALRNENCEYAFGDTPEQHGMGNWSDGQPVRILHVTPAAATAVEDVVAGKGVVVYPNPNNTANWQFTVDKKLTGNAIVITDVTGAEVFKSVIQSTTFEVNLDKAARSIYFYQVKSDEGSVIKTGKLIVE